MKNADDAGKALDKAIIGAVVSALTLGFVAGFLLMRACTIS